MGCPHPHRPSKPPATPQPPQDIPSDTMASMRIGRPETTYVYWEARLWRWLSRKLGRN